MAKSKTPLIACAVAGLVSLLSAPDSTAQLAASGTPGDRAVYTIGAVGSIADVSTLPSSTLTHDFDTETIADTADSFNLGADGGGDDTKIFLTGGHHIVIYGSEWDGGGERSGADSYLKLGGTKIPYGSSAAYTRDGTNRESFTRGGTIINVAQGEFLELESQRRDIFAVDEGDRNLDMQNADLQLIKLDDANLEFLRLKPSATTTLMPVGGSTPVNVPYDTQDELDTGSFGHSTTVDNDQITLKTPGHYLVFANTGVRLVGGVQRNCISQKIFLDDDGAGANPPALVTGGATTVYLRHAGATDGAGGLHDDGAAAVAVLVEVLNANSVLTVEITRDSTGSAASVELDETRTGLAIAKLPDYGDYISLGENGTGNNANINTTPASTRSFASNSAISTSSFDFAPGSPTQITVNKGNDYLFLASHYVEDYDTPGGGVRTVVKQAFQTTSGGAISWGAGGAYNRDQPAGNQAARDSGDWAGAIIRGGTDVTVGGGVQTTTLQLGNNPVVAPTSLSLQGINIASISIPPSNDPTIVINAPLNVTISTTGNLITDEAHLLTEDANTAATALSYNLDTVPSSGTLRLNGTALVMDDDFTQDDINNDRITFDAGASPASDSFNFTVTDGGANPASGTFVIEITSPESTVIISDDGDTAEGGVTDFILEADVAPVGANMTVTVAYSGTATSGIDFTGVTSIDILDGQTDATINVSALSDGLLEGAESVTATITDVSGPTVTGLIGSPASSTFFITDAGNNAPSATNLNQAVAGTGNVPLGDIVITDPDKTSVSDVSTAGIPVYQYNGISDVAIYGDGRPDTTGALDLDATGPALSETAGLSIQLKFIPQAADLTGTKLVWEIGGSSNGSTILLLDGVLHFLCKANGTGAHIPIDDLSVPGAFNDVDWGSGTDNTIVVPIDGATVVSPGVPLCISVIFDIAGGSVKSSVNGAAETVTTLTAASGTNFRGDHSVRHGVRNGGVGGSNSAAGNPFLDGGFGSLANGTAAISETIFWNESTGTLTTTAGTSDTLTATLTIASWVAGAGDLTAASGNGETYNSGVWTVTGTLEAVNAALAAVEFVSDAGTADPTTINVVIDDGNEDSSAALTGTVIVSATAADPIYVDDDFSGGFGDPIADGDLGDPGDQAATFGVSAFSNLADALAVVSPTGTIIVNDGDYSSENITMTDMVTLQLTDTAGPVQIGNISNDLTNAIDLSSNTLELGATNVSTGQIASPISGTGNLTKIGLGRVIIWAPTSHSGTTTVSGGFLRVGQNVGLDPSLQSELGGDGPVVVTAPGRLEFVVAPDTTVNQTGAISGTGSVATFNNGTLVFDGPGANTFSGGFELGDGAVSSFDGIDQGAKEGFVVVNHNDHLGSGAVLSRGSQLQAGTPGLVIPNDVNITGGGFRNGGLVDYELSGTITTIDGSPRGFGNYGLDGTDLTISGNIVTTAGGNVNFEASPNRDNGSWTVTGDISGPQNVIVTGSFSNGEVTFAGNHTHTGTTVIDRGTVIFNATQTGGGNFSVNNDAVLTGNGSTTSPVTIAGGATLSPGLNGVGTLATGSLTVVGTLASQIGSIVAVTGAVNVTGATLSLSTGPTAPPDTYVIVANDDAGADPVVGTFTGFPEGGAVDPLAAGFDGTVTYVEGLNDIAVTLTGLTVIGQWRADNYGSSADTGPGANSAMAANGLTNLQSFAFDLDPNAAAGMLDVSGGSILSLGPPTIWVDPATGRIYQRYTRRTDFASIPLTITDEFSRDLTVFEDSVIAPTVIATGTGASGATIEALQTEFPFTLPISGGKGRYGRVDVTTP